MARSDPTSIYEVLDIVRRRPPMYLGGDSPDLLFAFLAGLSYSTLDPGDPSIWDYPHWLSAHVLHRSSSFPLEEVATHLDRDPSLELYFEYLDIYRTCVLKELEVASPPFKPTFTVLHVPERDSGEKLDMEDFRAPKPPSNISLVRFSPCSVFAILEMYDHGVEIVHPFFHRAESARENAQERWSFDKDRWT